MEPNHSYAAVDLGSNSFHMIVARLQGNDLQVLDRLREPVRLADGMGDTRIIQPAAMQRALDCLHRFGERLAPLDPTAVRVVGTNTLRRAKNAESFLEDAEAALGHPIEIISGTEEARLIYAGIAPSIDPALDRRLVIDIGGGSTEVIIGIGTTPKLLESLPVGCVSLSQRCFPDGVIDKDHWHEAVLAAEVALEPIIQEYRKLGWDMAIGASGTIKEVQRVAELNGWSNQGITADALVAIQQRLLEAGHVDAIKIAELSEDRKPVIVGGLAILWALFECLHIDRLNVSDRALREGLLYEHIDRLQNDEIRSSAISTLATRYEVDIEHARRVEITAMELLEQVAQDWGLQRRTARHYLRWTAYLHEIGLAITHSKYNRHGAYLVRHSDVAGFSQTEQRILAALVYLQRGNFRQNELTEVPPRLLRFTLRLAALLRLAVIMHRSRRDEPLPPLQLVATEQTLALSLPAQWLLDHPLTAADLEMEIDYLRSADIQFRFNAVD